MMKPVIIEDYIEKIYGYAVNHTYTHDEADEMSQEILLMVLRNLPKLRVDSKFEPWLWGVANNVAKSFRRSMARIEQLIPMMFLKMFLFMLDMDYGMHQEIKELWDSRATKATSSYTYSAEKIKTLVSDVADYCDTWADEED